MDFLFAIRIFKKKCHLSSALSAIQSVLANARHYTKDFHKKSIFHANGRDKERYQTIDWRGTWFIGSQNSTTHACSQNRLNYIQLSRN